MKTIFLSWKTTKKMIFRMEQINLNKETITHMIKKLHNNLKLNM
jgi:hypothetical protein